jgi:hypothetical protein
MPTHVSRPPRRQARMATQVAREVEANLREDRSFWDELVVLMVESTDHPDLGRIVNTADHLTAARRERFPVEDSE